MTKLYTLALCMLAGYLLRKFEKLDKESIKTLNVFVVYVSFPALVIHHITATLFESGLHTDLLLPISMPWLLVVLAYAGFSLAGWFLGWSNQVVGALVLTAGFANTSLVGFPLLEALMGPESLRTAIIISQIGSFLALSTLGLVMAAGFSGQSGRFDSGPMAKRLFSFPPFLALLFSVGIYLLGIDLPESVDQVMLDLASSLVPVALVAVGAQVDFDFISMTKYKLPLALGLGFKLFLVPLLFILLFVFEIEATGREIEITVLESAMAPMITGAIVAERFDLDSELAYLLVCLGIPLSFFTVPGWFWAIDAFFN
jgi:hypothetical protein